MKFKKKKAAAILLLLLVMLAIAPTFVRAFTIAGPSMSPTIWVNDRVISAQAAYDLRVPYSDAVLFRVSDPKRNDLVIYYDKPKAAIAAKRVIGVPGDKIELRENVIYVNDVAAKQKRLPRESFDHVPAENGLGDLVLEEQLDGSSHLITYTPKAGKLTTYGPVVVPPNKFFILGDHRDNSSDSRFIGFITRDQIKGRIAYGTRTH